MKLLRYALAPLLAVALAAPAFAEKLSLPAISSYLNGLQTAQADFTQVNSDGSISTGKIYIQRPGRARFEYRITSYNVCYTKLLRDRREQLLRSKRQRIGASVKGVLGPLSRRGGIDNGDGQRNNFV